ncbi:hypothetical protein Scep_007726 [Stephania cephalantha]|uniref:Uncharacterized protein n=1 Tax=Stephania cephalantha TaxID=152367 RepID=A0AAP0KCE2_9MAGN
MTVGGNGQTGGRRVVFGGVKARPGGRLPTAPPIGGRAGGRRPPTQQKRKQQRAQREVICGARKQRQRGRRSGAQRVKSEFIFGESETLMGHKWELKWCQRGIEDADKALAKAAPIWYCRTGDQHEVSGTWSVNGGYRECSKDMWEPGLSRILLHFELAGGVKRTNCSSEIVEEDARTHHLTAAVAKREYCSKHAGRVGRHHVAAALEVERAREFEQRCGKSMARISRKIDQQLERK